MAAAAVVLQRDINIFLSEDNTNSYIMSVNSGGTAVCLPVLLSNRANLHFSLLVQDAGYFQTPEEANPDAEPAAGRDISIQHINEQYPLSVGKSFSSPAFVCYHQF